MTSLKKLKPQKVAKQIQSLTGLIVTKNTINNRFMTFFETCT
jgi:hypothetical protein